MHASILPCSTDGSAPYSQQEKVGLLPKTNEHRQARLRLAWLRVTPLAEREING